MKVLIVTQYFWPESFVINALAELLQAQGVKVGVLTGQPNYPDGVIFKGYGIWNVSRERHRDVDIFRMPLLPRGRNSRWRLALNYVSFILSGFIVGPWILRREPFDLVFVYAPSPLLQALPAVRLARRRRVPLVVWVQDLWPESLQAVAQVSNRWILKAVSTAVKSIYRASDRILVQSRAFTGPVAALTDRPEKIFYYPNPFQPAPGGEESSRAADLVGVLRRHFCVVFAGNLGTAQALDTVLDAAKLLSPHPNIRIVLVGSGSKEAWLTEQCEQRRIGNVVLAGRFDPSDMTPIFAAASALLVTLKPDPALALTTPSKVQAYLAAGRPIIAALDGEGARIIQESGAGLCSPAGDADALAASIARMAQLPSEEREAMGARGRDYFAEHFAPERLVGELMQHFEQVIAASEKAK
jgi:glycosyltransferase involved in cell wall biosynthesis